MFYKIPLSYFCHWTLLDMKHASKMEKFWFTFPFPSISEPKQAVCLPPLKSGLILQGCIPSVTWKISIVEPGLGKNRVGIKSRDSRNKENSWQVVLRNNQEEQTLFRAKNQLEHIRATVQLHLRAKPKLVSDYKIMQRIEQRALTTLDISLIVHPWIPHWVIYVKKTWGLEFNQWQ